MADPEQIRIINRGEEAWNEWRDENPEVIPDLKAAHLSFIDLREADLYGADFSKADLSGSLLLGADCRYVNFKGANLIGTDFSGALTK